MRANLLKERWSEGQAALNGWLMMPSPLIAEMMAQKGFDALTIDMQHGLMGYETAVTMLQAISTTNVTPVVRVPWNDPAMMMRMADAGAYGIICPMVNSRAECEAFVGALRYPPNGYRSYGPVRARLYAGQDYFDNANSLVATIAMIETAEALEALDDICATPGLDALYVGPADLSISLGGVQKSDYTDPFLISKLEQIVAAGRKHGVAVGLHNATPEYASTSVDMGFQFVTAATDFSLLEGAANDVVERYVDARLGRNMQNQESASSGPY